MSAGHPDPETADRDEIATWCGIRNPRAIPEARVPVEAYRDGGLVACDRTGQEPDPPWIVVANYELPDGSAAVLAADAYAAVLAEAYGLDDGPAECLALHRAGWTAQDVASDAQPTGWHVADAPDLLAEAKSAVQE